MTNSTETTSDSGSLLPSSTDPDRRRLLGYALPLAMTGGLAASASGFVTVAGKFLYPSNADALGWQFVKPLKNWMVGESVIYVAPSRLKVVIARLKETDEAESFIALSSVCPHLGCQVHWESHKDRFFCPCHAGSFDAEGKPLEGPPKAANQELTRFPLQIENGSLFVEVPLHQIT